MLDKLKILAIIVSISFSASALTACNTLAGAGEDVEAAGSSLEKSAERNKSY